MEIILLKDVEKVGYRGDVVRVRDGYARNFLIPRLLAMAATRANRQFVEEQKARSAKRREKERQKAEEQARKMREIKLTIEARVGEKDKLFGSVTSADICEALNLQGYHVNKKQIELEQPIHALGTYPVMVEIYPQVKATVTVEVVQQKS